MTEYQPNSHRSKEAQAKEPPVEKKKIEKVVTGTVKTRENKGRKLADVFISEDVSNVKSYVLMDVLVPAIKKAISDIVTNGVDMILYGGKGSGGSSRSTSKVSYRSYYDDRSRRDETSYRSGSRFEYDDIIFETRSEAEAVRRQMEDTIARYGIVTVSDMYDMAGLNNVPYTGNSYGWASIRTAETVHVRDGYILKLPKASPID